MIKHVEDEPYGLLLSPSVREQRFFCDFLRDAPEATGEEEEGEELEAPKVISSYI